MTKVIKLLLKYNTCKDDTVPVPYSIYSKDTWHNTQSLSVLSSLAHTVIIHSTGLVVVVVMECSLALQHPSGGWCWTPASHCQVHATIQEGEGRVQCRCSCTENRGHGGGRRARWLLLLLLLQIGHGGGGLLCTLPRLHDSVGWRRQHLVLFRDSTG